MTDELGRGNAAALRVAVSIVTRNRVARLRDTLHALASLSPAPDAVHVYADACTDGTEAMLAGEFPGVIIHASPEPRGSIFGRDCLLREADADIVLSLDDDSHPVETDFMARLKQLHATHAEVAVFTFPQVTEEFPETLREPETLKRGVRRSVASYTDSGASYWRPAYLRSPGFVKAFFHAYEEPDYALQCVAAGRLVVLEPSLTIRHHYSPLNRNGLRTHALHCRNEVWSVLLRCPWPLLPVVLLFRVVRQAVNACRLGGWDWVVREPLWWWEALVGVGAILKQRQVVAVGGYLDWLRLSKRPQVLA